MLNIVINRYKHKYVKILTTATTTTSASTTSANTTAINGLIYTPAAVTAYTNSISNSEKEHPPKRYPKPLKTHQYGVDILHDSLWNKGMYSYLSILTDTYFK